MKDDSIPILFLYNLEASVSKEINDLIISKAKKAQQNAYAPYSKFHVGAAVATVDLQIFEGCNIESASYGLTICAERVAIFNAVSQGYTNFTHLALVSDSNAFPCGACRQIIFEFCPKASIIIVTQNGIVKTSSQELLPNGFGKEDIA